MFNKPAVTRKHLLSPQLGSGMNIVQVEIKEVNMEPPAPVPLHLHPCAVVGVIAEGKIAYQLEGETAQHLSSGNAFYEPAGARVARFDNEGDTTARFVAFYLLESETQELITML